MKPKLLRSISVRLPEDLLEKVDAKCEASSISRSNLFRAALEGRLESDKKTNEGEGSLPCQLLR
jgi:metal-responsive CopG/Arc/MetJ family transcriptional regulator